jgi:tripeptidyl-peptidase-2
LALIVSALKAEGQTVTPARVRRAVENTALPVDPAAPDSVLTYGRGLLQVAAAYEYLHRAAAEGVDVPAELRLDVTARRSDGAAVGRGIYMREPADALHAVIYQ